MQVARVYVSVSPTASMIDGRDSKESKESKESIVGHNKISSVAVIAQSLILPRTGNIKNHTGIDTDVGAGVSVGSGTGSGIGTAVRVESDSPASGILSGNAASSEHLLEEENELQLYQMTSSSLIGRGGGGGPGKGTCG